ncbi:MAG: DMT family transporter, partial [Janthinobacterium lividum]
MNLIELLVLGAIWGASFLCMRIAAPEFGPLPLIFLRVGIAALFLLPVMRSRRARSAMRQKAWPLFVIGMTNSALPFSLFAYSMLTLSAGFDAILNASTPVWTALVALAWLKTPISRLQLAGLAIGLGGVMILMWDKIGISGGADHATLAVSAVVLATICYGFAIN